MIAFDWLGSQERPVTSQTRGVDLFHNILLRQYRGKPNIEANAAVVFEELDVLFNELDDVYFGRMLDFAVGVQLDKVGALVAETRSLSKIPIYFGYAGAPNTGGFGTGALYRDGEATIEYEPLGDEEYRRLIRAKCFILLKQQVNHDQVYFIIDILNGSVVEGAELTVQGHKHVRYTCPLASLSEDTPLLIRYFQRNLVPLGVRFELLLT